MSPIVRFAPSPTGYLHIGNLRTALFNWLLAKEGGAGGTFILRYDDTDAERSRAEYADAILEDIRWIGMRPDRVERQSDRIAHYDAAVERLKAAGSLYPCYETLDDLDRRRKRQIARGLPPVYSREALRLTAAERERLEAEGRHPHWRFLLPNFADDPFAPVRTEVSWNDLVRGDVGVDLASLSDPVLVREDGSYLYTLPSVVDDGEMGITHVIRGDDHVTNTGVQIAILRALGFTVPTFGHHNLLTMIDGTSLSKRSGALSLRSLREEGIEPMAVASLAALVGMAGSIEAMTGLGDLAGRVALADVSASASKFDPAEVDRLNAELVHRSAYDAVAGGLAAMDVPADEAETFWLAVRGNCGKVRDAALWREIVFGDLAEPPVFEDGEREFVRSAFDLLPPAPWSGETWATWTAAVKASTSRKGKALFMPLRKALTGLDHGPELAELLPLMGQDQVLRRRP